MLLKIIIISIIMVALAGIGIAVKFYKNKNAPVYCHKSRKEHHFENGVCAYCGMEEEEYLNGHLNR
jgi:hypothetical protein